MEPDYIYMGGNGNYLRALDQSKGLTSLEEAIRVAVTQELERENPLLSNEMAMKIAEHCKRVAKKVAEHPVFAEVAKNTVARSNEMAKRMANENSARYQANSDALATKKAEYETALTKWVSSDEATRRFNACWPQIENLLPVQGDHYTKQQAIRSRGLVFAAIFGLRQMGSPLQKEAYDYTGKEIDE